MSPATRARRKRARGRVAGPGAFLLALGIGLAGCTQEPAAALPAPVWPAGTVLALDGVAIHAEEVDAVADVYARLQPQFTEPHCRRLALTNVIFPRVAAQGIAPDRRAAARAQAEQYSGALVQGSPPAAPVAGPAEIERSGSWKKVGLEAWSAAIDRTDDRWSVVHETPGAFQIVRLKERGKESAAAGQTLTLGVFEFPYLDPSSVRSEIDAALDRSKLVFVDPAWRDYVPSNWQHRLHANEP